MFEPPKVRKILIDGYSVELKAKMGKLLLLVNDKVAARSSSALVECILPNGRKVRGDYIVGTMSARYHIYVDDVCQYSD